MTQQGIPVVHDGEDVKATTANLPLLSIVTSLKQKIFAYQWGGEYNARYR